MDPFDISGRTFATVRWPIAPSAGPIDLRASRAWTWVEREGRSSTQRLLLEGDVRLRLGVFTFAAERAALWLEPLEPAPSGAQRWQVYAYLDRVTTPVGDGQIMVRGDRVPVKGVIELPLGSSIALAADRRADGPIPSPLLADGERALAAALRRVARPDPGPGDPPAALLERGQPIPPLSSAPPRDPLDAQRLLEAQRALGEGESSEPIFAQGGIFTFAAGSIESQPGEAENTVTLTGRVLVQYLDRQRGRHLQISADRAVVFLAPGPLGDLASLGADAVRGIYLEGDVQASDGRYNLRAPRIYYSVADNRAIILDAVFWTFDERRNLPLYLRAKAIRQESADEFRATSARLTNTAFFDPELSIGASAVTITRAPSPQGDQRLFVDARNVTLRAGGVPFFYLPRLRGEADQPPLRDVRVENSNASGTAFKTTWNLPALLGLRTRREVTSDLLVDYYFDRGLAFGTDTTWAGENNAGALFAYLVPSDTGRDVLASGERRERDGELRGIVALEHRARITDRWTFIAEASHISDATFIDGFFEPLARTRREFTSRLTARRLDENTILTATAQGSFDRFIANQYLLQSPGYTVERLPDVRYVRLADNLLEDYPGLLTYSSEYRASSMRLRFDRTPARDRGYSTPFLSQSAFGLLPEESIADALRRRGFTQTSVARLDTRHELTAALAAGPVNVTPFAAGRGTLYTENFEAYAGREEDGHRLWAAAGITASVEVQRVYNAARSRILDVHRLRHVIRPGLTLWHAGTTRRQDTLPIYDPDVEALQSGSAARLAIDQTLQTQRGGPGRWRSVDWITWDNELVIPSRDTDRISPIGRWNDARPELSQLGESFWRTDASWQLTEVVGLGGGLVYDFSTSQLARSNAAVTFQHFPGFTSFAEMRSINPLDETFINFGATYELSAKYGVSGAASYNTELGQLQSISGEFRRRFPGIVMGLGISYNQITNRTSFGFVLQPLGVGGGSTRATTISPGGLSRGTDF